MDTIKIGIVTTSDRAYSGVYEDISGKEIQSVIQGFIQNPCEFHYELVADVQEDIEKALKKLADEIGCDLIITTGGTGPSKRDVTPEATEAVCEKMLPGFGEAMRNESLKFVPTAILSRQTAGIRKSSLIINLPGKPKSIEQCLQAIFPAIPYCVDLIDGNYIQANEEKITAFRPKDAYVKKRRAE